MELNKSNFDMYGYCMADRILIADESQALVIFHDVNANTIRLYSLIEQNCSIKTRIPGQFAIGNWINKSIASLCYYEKGCFKQLYWTTVTGSPKAHPPAVALDCGPEAECRALTATSDNLLIAGFEFPPSPSTGSSTPSPIHSQVIVYRCDGSTILKLTSFNLAAECTPCSFDIHGDLLVVSVFYNKTGTELVEEKKEEKEGKGEVLEKSSAEEWKPIAIQIGNLALLRRNITQFSLSPPLCYDDTGDVLCRESIIRPSFAMSRPGMLVCFDDHNGSVFVHDPWHSRYLKRIRA